jgi:hypothetical protein
MNIFERCHIIIFYTLFLIVSISVGQNHSSTSNSKKDYGIVVCTGEGDMFLETVTMIEQTRNRLESKLSIAVAHCNELSRSSISILMSMTGVEELNLCTPNRPFYVNLKSRLHGFFCKPAALLLSPFEHTMLVDSDVIFFKKPELLFNSHQYQMTGTLFFRDRWTLTKNRLSLTKGQNTGKFAFNYIKSAAEELRRRIEGYLNNSNPRNSGKNSKPYLSEPYNKKFNVTELQNTNAFWGHLSGQGGKFTVDHWQDSSTVLFNKASHPLTLMIMKHFLGSFDSGYGDKEMYWLSATAAREPFAFEPHVAGSLGDCGALIHFDPRFSTPKENRITSRTLEERNRKGLRNGEIIFEEKQEKKISSNHLKKLTTAEPFYVNAEYLISHKHLKNVSDFLYQPSGMITNPLPMNEMIGTSPLSRGGEETPLFNLKPWAKLEFGFYPCGACKHATCKVLEKSNVVSIEIEIRQKMLLLLRDNLSKATVPLDLGNYQSIRRGFASDLNFEG